MATPPPPLELFNGELKPLVGWPTTSSARKREGGNDRGEDQAPGPGPGPRPGPDGSPLPEDGYEWKKYGQKYIQRIGKNRSYFKCRRQNCIAKKRVDWPPHDHSNMRIVYDGVHNHPPTSSPQEASGSSSAPNPYDLRAQVLGQPDEPS